MTKVESHEIKQWNTNTNEAIYKIKIMKQVAIIILLQAYLHVNTYQY